MSTGKFLGEPVDVIEVAVGLVLVLLVELGVVVGLVVEFALAAEVSEGGSGVARSDGWNSGWT